MITLGIRAMFACALLATSGAAVAANNWTYSELNKTVPGQGGNSPEDDARPGEYYFMRGVEAFRADNFGQAVKMYEAAASWGYKNAQYNLAVMYARGQGVTPDLPRAMAWAALAAERNDKQYVEAREAIYASLTKEQWDEANVIWRDLKKEYADAVALERAKARWAEVRHEMTGSHVGASGGRLDVGTPTGVPTVGKTFTATDGAAQAHPLTASTAGDVAGADTVDGTIAYRRLRETNNPYDPKFDPVSGTATVEAPIPAGEKTKNDADDKH